MLDISDQEQELVEAVGPLQCDLQLLITRPELPRKKWQAFNHSNVKGVPALEGVFLLADSK